ncbi:Ig-like domain-containing protein [Mycobacterium sp. ITM-2016-00317]|uniref:Ig-like domain-containing protein n=1 Tax=Mycobacterium sp. ITM-2016-00317 TaxID=2099694 RepID=UPI00287FA4DF|nr:Ig-like domain-containing protein [Mycobacterium sp. ITM-2016-00317]WNG88860.1 Ig-like domain-containing protein [Mycobacterium sp. ITM-2016-00317]
MGYAKYIGRVGALAVVLGIGTAIASPAGAETSTSEATSSSASPSDSADSADSAATESPTHTPATGAHSDDTDDSDGTDESTEDVEETDEDIDVDDDIADPADPEPVDSEPVDPEPVDPEPVEDEPVEDELPDPAPEVRDSSAAPPVGEEPAGAEDTVDDASQIADPVDDSEPTGHESPAADVVAVANPAVPEDSSPESTSAVESPGAPAPAPLVRQPVTPIGALLGAPFALINIAVEALNMLFSPAPGTPTDPPILWGVLAFVHREIHRTFFNSAPYAVADTATTSEDVPATIPVLANDTDPNDDPLTITKYTQPANGTVVLNPDGTFTYTPNADFHGTDTFTYTISDEASPWHVHGLISLLFRGGHASTATVAIAVGAVNDAPTINPDRPATDSTTGVVTADLNAADVDGDALTYEVTTPSRGTVTIVDGAFVYTPTAEARAAAGQGGPATDTFTVTVSDGNGGAVSQTFTVAVTPNIDNITIELLWGAAPRDLDSHLLGPGIGGNGQFHLYYGNKNLAQSDGALAANLAADDINGFGPELTTIFTRTPGEYLFYVHRLSTEAGWDVSEASVTVRDSVSGIDTVFTISDEATGRFWSVFTLTISDTGLVTVTPVDTYSETGPILPTTPTAL